MGTCTCMEAHRKHGPKEAHLALELPAFNELAYAVALSIATFSASVFCTFGGIRDMKMLREAAFESRLGATWDSKRVGESLEDGIQASNNSQKLRCMGPSMAHKFGPAGPEPPPKRPSS
jgi:hypothetical protein